MKLSRYVTNKFHMFIGIVLKLIEAVIEVLLPISMSLLIENGIINNNKNYILIIAIIMFAMVVLAYICSISAQYLAYVVSENYSKELRGGLYDKISSFSPTQFNEFSSSTLTNRLTLDVNQSANAISMSIRVASRAPFLMIGSLVAIYLIHGLLALILLIGMTILIPILVILLKISMNLFKKTQKKNDELTKNVKNNLTGMRIIRAFSKQEKEINGFQEINTSISKSINKLNLFQLMSSPLTTIFMYVIMVIMLFVSIPFVKDDLISVAVLSTTVSYTTQLIVALVSVMNLVMVYTRSMASNQRIKEIFLVEVEKESDNQIYLPEKIDTIQFNEVTYTYPRRSKPSVMDINLDIKTNEIIALTGKTGSGKSTVMQMLAGYFRAQKGEILINDIPLERFKLTQIKNRIGYVSQKASFLKGTIFDNITMGNERITEEIVIESLKKAEAYEFVVNKENGIYGSVEEKGSNFSGGQRQRLALARAFAHRYDVLILDDSFSALDYLTEARIREHILSDFKDKILILISVRKSTLDIANRIYVIDKGFIESEGTHEELVLKSELYNQLVEG